MPTALELYEAAYSRSTFNDPDKLATKQELIGVIDRRLKQLYSIAARQNPTYFGKKSTAAFAAAITALGGELGWARPTDAELIFRIEAGTPGVTGVLTAGVEVSVMPYEDKLGETPPVVYEYGGVYLPSGRTGDPIAHATTGDKLVFCYSRRHADLNAAVAPDHANNTLDTAWPTQYNDLIVLHIAKYLATKDGRGNELQVLNAEEEILLADFSRHLGHVNYAMKARFGQRTRLINPRLNESQ